MATKDWVTLSISIIALALSMLSLYFSRRRDVEGRQLEAVRSHYAVLKELESIERNIHNKIARLRALFILIKEHELEDKHTALIVKINTMIDQYGRILGSIVQRHASLQNKSYESNAIPHRTRVEIEGIFRAYENIREAFDAHEDEFDSIEKDMLTIAKREDELAQREQPR